MSPYAAQGVRENRAPFTAAIAQFPARLGDPAANLERIRALAVGAATGGAAIVCFPELCLCGYTNQPVDLRPEPVPGPSSSELMRIATDLGVALLAGLAEQDGDRVYSTHLVALPGEPLTIYRKTHLGRSERPVFTPGDELPVFEWLDVRFGLALCYDWQFPEVAACLSMQGAEVAFAPFAAPMPAPRRLEIWQRYMPARARDNRMLLAACNELRCTDADPRGGGLAVWGPDGVLTSTHDSQSEYLLTFDIDPDALAAFRCPESASMRRRFFPADRRPDLYHRYLCAGP